MPIGNTESKPRGGIIVPNTGDFEQLYSEFLESREADTLCDEMHTVMRRAFLAGYQAAGGEPIRADRIIEFRPKRSQPPK